MPLNHYWPLATQVRAWRVLSRSEPSLSEMVTSEGGLHGCFFYERRGDGGDSVIWSFGLQGAGSRDRRVFLGKEILELTRLLQWLLPNHDPEVGLKNTAGPRYRACAKVLADERLAFWYQWRQCMRVSYPLLGRRCGYLGGIIMEVWFPSVSFEWFRWQVLVFVLFLYLIWCLRESTHYLYLVSVWLCVILFIKGESLFWGHFACSLQVMNLKKYCTQAFRVNHAQNHAWKLPVYLGCSVLIIFWMVARRNNDKHELDSEHERSIDYHGKLNIGIGIRLRWLNTFINYSVFF
jgi:hypothetical protein